MSAARSFEIGRGSIATAPAGDEAATMSER
jgi:hypothetical protein